jgi:tyrosyl-tRNA synthetase
MKVVTDEKKIDELLSRGIENIFPSREFLKSKMMKGERLTLYLGIDPTGPTLHLGHVIPLLRLSKFQKLGHRVILLMGDFTAMVGDPTDKMATRKKLSHKEVVQNLKEYKKQASKIISFSGANKAEFKFNSKWLAKKKFNDILEFTSLVTVEQMLKRDMFARRIEENKPIYIHEFLYPLMQGIDSVEMDVDGEIGGNDQTFNMLVGRDLVKSINNKEKFVIATKLLTDSSGQKMGKTENNMVALNQDAKEMFGKVMSWSDGLIIPGFEIITDVSMEEIGAMRDSMNSGVNPRDLKLRLAHEITKIFYGEKEAEKAKTDFNDKFQKKEIPDEVEEVAGSGVISPILLSAGLVSSKGEAFRLLKAGAVTDLTDNKKMTESDEVVKGHVYKVGKHRFIKIK